MTAGLVYSIERQGGGKAVAVEDLALFIGSGELTPVDPERVVAVAPGDVGGIAIGIDRAPAPVPARLRQGAHVPVALEKRQPVRDGVAWELG